MWRIRATDAGYEAVRGETQIQAATLVGLGASFRGAPDRPGDAGALTDPRVAGLRRARPPPARSPQLGPGRPTRGQATPPTLTTTTGGLKMAADLGPNRDRHLTSPHCAGTTTAANKPTAGARPSPSPASCTGPLPPDATTPWAPTATRRLSHAERRCPTRQACPWLVHVTLSAARKPAPEWSGLPLSADRERLITATASDQSGPGRRSRESSARSARVRLRPWPSARRPRRSRQVGLWSTAVGLGRLNRRTIHLSFRTAARWRPTDTRLNAV